LTNYAALLENYSFSEILEINDITEEEVLEYLVEQDYLVLPVCLDE